METGNPPDATVLPQQDLTAPAQESQETSDKEVKEETSKVRRSVRNRRSRIRSPAPPTPIQEPKAKSNDLTKANKKRSSKTGGRRVRRPRSTSRRRSSYIRDIEGHMKAISEMMKSFMEEQTDSESEMESETESEAESVNENASENENVSENESVPSEDLDAPKRKKMKRTKKSKKSKGKKGRRNWLRSLVFFTE